MSVHTRGAANQLLSWCCVVLSGAMCLALLAAGLTTAAQPAQTIGCRWARSGPTVDTLMTGTPVAPSYPVDCGARSPAAFWSTEHAARQRTHAVLIAPVADAVPGLSRAGRPNARRRRTTST
jgi:hypothetical protein